jgi:two-component system, cell cycle sensor histidine kinase and response regulator CckA
LATVRRRTGLAEALGRLIAALDVATGTPEMCVAGVEAARVALATDDVRMVGVPGFAGADETPPVSGEGAPRVERAATAWVVTAPMGDGRALVARTRARPTRARLDAIAAIATLLRHVFAREARAERTRQNEARLEAILSNTPNVAIEGYDRQGRVLWWNRAAERVFGWSAASAVGRTLDALMLDAEGAAAFLATLDEIARTGQPAAPMEWACRRPDGEEVVVISTIFAIPAPDGGEQFVCMDVDVTEARRTQERLRQSEAQLRQSQKMEAVGRLAGGVAHDFNNTLVAILGYADLLARTLPAGGMQRRQADEIVAAARRAASLTTQLLAFSRQQVPAPRAIDFGAVVAGIEGMMRRLIGEDVTLSVRVPDRPTWVLADAGQVEQVLLNLVVNARDAMPEGGRLDVEVRAPEPGGEPVARLLVSDTGCGMTEDVRARMFEPFFTTKPAGKGTGLGLSMVYGIVHQWRGEVAVESAPGRGTTFRVSVPVTEPPAPEMRVRAPAEGEAAGGTLLVVEDERAVREYLAEVLAGEGYRVIVAADPEEALGLATEIGEVDLLVTDVVMPGMSGPALVRTLRKSRPDLRALYISGYAAGTLAEQRPDPRAAFLQKPFTLGELRAKVRSLLGPAVSG